MKRAVLLISLGLIFTILSGCTGDDSPDDGATDGDQSTMDGDAVDGDAIDGDAEEASIDGDALEDEWSDGDETDGDEEDLPPIEYEPLSLTFSDPPIDLGDIQADFAMDVAYGEDELQGFDIFLADAEEATPLIIYIHGGGFTGGEKEGIYGSADEILEALSNGVSFATINYRLLAEVDHDGVIKSLSDSARCLQFIRYFADTINIDPEQIAAYGGSAGAGTSLWLGFHDEMADEDNRDPVLRESTRLKAVGAIETQSTYDLVRWTTDIFWEYSITFEMVFFLLPSAEQLLNSFYGIDTFEDIYSDKITAYRANVDMLALMSDDDAPMYLKNTTVPYALPTDLDAFFHHPNHALFLKDQADAVGLDYIAHIPELEIVDASNTKVVPFLMQYLEVPE